MDEEFQFEPNNALDLYISFKDKNGRIILKVIGDRVLVTRYEDMDEYTKNQVIYLYSELTGSNELEKEVKGFLNFENDKNEFCS